MVSIPGSFRPGDYHPLSPSNSAWVQGLGQLGTQGAHGSDLRIFKSRPANATHSCSTVIVADKDVWMPVCMPLSFLKPHSITRLL